MQWACLVYLCSNISVIIKIIRNFNASHPYIYLCVSANSYYRGREAMYTKYQLLFFITIFMVFIASATAGESDYVTISDPNFENVDVVLETDWGTSEKTESVDVLVVNVNDEPAQLILARKKVKLSEISIMEGVVIKIYNHETGELLKTYRVKS